jgi:peptidyl-prolyl cis-trans isomerase C
MFCKIIFRVGFCIFLLAITSCSAPEGADLETSVEVQSEEQSSDSSEVIIGLGNEKLTRQRVSWMWPRADDEKLVGLAKWWLETELLYAEAERRGITNDAKINFVTELRRKQSFAQELVTQLLSKVKISDEKISAYYEENKETDIMLKRLGNLSFTHVRTKTLEEAEAVLERIKAGEDIYALAKELSIYHDAGKGGGVQKYGDGVVKRRFGNEFYEAITSVEKGGLIGPIKVEGDVYEVARLDEKVESETLTFEEAKGRINVRLRETEQRDTLTAFLDSLKEKAGEKIVKSALITAAEDKSKEDKQGGEGTQQ